MTSAAKHVDEARLWGRHMDMAAIGARTDGGVNRQALSAEDARARALLVEWARSLGFDVASDPIGNLFVRREGTERGATPVLTGSHLDSQPTGGKFDGAYGVLAGFEALEALQLGGIVTRRPIELVAWCNEEGSRFAPGAMGSAAFAHALPLETALAIKDREDKTVGAALAEMPTLPPRPLGFPVHAYVEAHIEQGPVLEREAKTIGAVTGIQGSQWFTVEVRGAEAHAGTAPLRTRQDALKAAVAMIAALETWMADETDRVRFTVGRLDVSPNSPNTVPGRVVFTIDFRHPDGAVLVRLGDGIERICHENARGCAVTVTKNFDAPPCAFDPRIIDTIEQSAAILGLSRMRLPSGAFHDAKHMVDLCPTGMIFVPCEKGISHNPVENAKPSDLAAGARVLATVLEELAR
jgi:N-carbamoyl-L-amino-acid hydrolase